MLVTEKGCPKFAIWVGDTRLPDIGTYIRFTESDLLAMHAFLDEALVYLKAVNQVQAPRAAAS